MAVGPRGSAGDGVRGGIREVWDGQKGLASQFRVLLDEAQGGVWVAGDEERIFVGSVCEDESVGLMVAKDGVEELEIVPRGGGSCGGGLGPGRHWRKVGGLGA